MRRLARWLAAGVVAVSLGIAGLFALSQGESVDADALVHDLGSGDPPLVLDVRSRVEYEAGHVPGAVHVPFLDVDSPDTEVPAEPDDPVVVYCELGPRAGIAKLALERRGFTNVRLLEGHMAGWRRAGLPRETAQD